MKKVRKDKWKKKLSELAGYELTILLRIGDSEMSHCKRNNTEAEYYIEENVLTLIMYGYSNDNIAEYWQKKLPKCYTINVKADEQDNVFVYTIKLITKNYSNMKTPEDFRVFVWKDDSEQKYNIIKAEDIKEDFLHKCWSEHSIDNYCDYDIDNEEKVVYAKVNQEAHEYAIFSSDNGFSNAVLLAKDDRVALDLLTHFVKCLPN